MRCFLRSQLEQLAPSILNIIRPIRNRHYFQRTFSQRHQEFRQMLFPDGATISVQCGHFKGLLYFDETVWGSITPKWLGSYEAELHPVIHQIAVRSCKTIIDVGCAEGYYAVGLVKILPATKIFAFDADFISRAQVRRLANLNHVSDRLEARSFCSHSDIDTLSVGRTLVVCDIEGFEVQLLNPKFATALCRNDILVEIHESLASSLEVEQLLQSRFKSSHHIERIEACNRDLWIEHNLAELPASIQHSALYKATDESRDNGRVWFWMQANHAWGEFRKSSRDHLSAHLAVVAPHQSMLLR